nr:fumarylacetoacetate hydrolase family protein [Sphingomonas sp. CDS-1]
MKFISYRSVNGLGTALDLGGTYKGLDESQPCFPGTIDDLLARGGTALADAAGILRRHGTGISLMDVELLPPVNPSKIICIGLNYADHARESGLPIPEKPTVFARFPSSIVGPEAPIMLPKVSGDLDYEGELAVIIGKAGRYICPAEALDHVAGYSCFNDGSIRDYQFHGSQWTVGKNFDRSGSLGPALVTADSLPAGAAGLAIRTRLNGQTVQSSSIGELIFGVAKLISLLSEAFTLLPGDVIATGTPSGVGFARTPQLWMKAGDICEVEIEAIGTLRNPVRAES